VPGRGGRKNEEERERQKGGITRGSEGREEDKEEKKRRGRGKAEEGK